MLEFPSAQVPHGPDHGRAGRDDAQVDFQHAAEGVGDTLPGLVIGFDFIGEGGADDADGGGEKAEAHEEVEGESLASGEFHVADEEDGEEGADDVGDDGEDWDGCQLVGSAGMRECSQPRQKNVDDVPPCTMIRISKWYLLQQVPGTCILQALFTGLHWKMKAKVMARCVTMRKAIMPYRNLRHRSNLDIRRRKRQMAILHSARVMKTWHQSR